MGCRIVVFASGWPEALAIVVSCTGLGVVTLPGPFWNKREVNRLLPFNCAPSINQSNILAMMLFEQFEVGWIVAESPIYQGVGISVVT